MGAAAGMLKGIHQEHLLYIRVSVRWLDGCYAGALTFAFVASEKTCDLLTGDMAMHLNFNYPIDALPLMAQASALLLVGERAAGIGACRRGLRARKPDTAIPHYGCVRPACSGGW
jgi:hypothetical protein